VQPHYKTDFVEGGVRKTEWLEVCELPVKKLAAFEAALDKEEEEEAEIKAAKRPGTAHSRGSLAAPSELPPSYDEEDEEEEEEEDDE